MIKVCYDTDCNIDLLKGKTVTIIECGSQGHTHALNPKDGRVNVVVNLRSGSKSHVEAEEAGLAVLDTAEVAKAGDIIMILIPDQDRPNIYERDVEPNLEEGSTLAFAHGLPTHFSQIVTPVGVDVTMYTPKSPGHTVRGQYQEGRSVPLLITVHQDASGKVHDYALAYAGNIGAGRAGIIEATFKEETETDLSGEQAVLCGSACELMQAGSDALVGADCELGMAYFECIHEMKLVVDLISSGGFVVVCYSISDTVEHSDYVTGKRLITEETCREMKKVLTEVQDGTFIGNWITKNRAVGHSCFLVMRHVHTTRPSEKVGEKLRKMMSWLKKQGGVQYG